MYVCGDRGAQRRLPKKETLELPLHEAPWFARSTGWRKKKEVSMQRFGTHAKHKGTSTQGHPKVTNSSAVPVVRA